MSETGWRRITYWNVFSFFLSAKRRTIHEKCFTSGRISCFVCICSLLRSFAPASSEEGKHFCMLKKEVGEACSNSNKVQISACHENLNLKSLTLDQRMGCWWNSERGVCPGFQLFCSGLDWRRKHLLDITDTVPLLFARCCCSVPSLQRCLWSCWRPKTLSHHSLWWGHWKCCPLVPPSVWWLHWTHQRWTRLQSTAITTPPSGSSACSPGASSSPWLSCSTFSASSSSTTWSQCPGRTSPWLWRSWAVWWTSAPPWFSCGLLS